MREIERSDQNPPEAKKRNEIRKNNVARKSTRNNISLDINKYRIKRQATSEISAKNDRNFEKQKDNLKTLRVNNFKENLYFNNFKSNLVSTPIKTCVDKRQCETKKNKIILDSSAETVKLNESDGSQSRNSDIIVDISNKNSLYDLTVLKNKYNINSCNKIYNPFNPVILNVKSINLRHKCKNTTISQKTRKMQAKILQASAYAI